MLQLELEGSFLGLMSLKSLHQVGGGTRSVVTPSQWWHQVIVSQLWDAGVVQLQLHTAFLPGDILLPATATAVVPGLEEPSATMRTSLPVLLP